MGEEVERQADCTHEVRPVKSGRRVALTYRIITTATKSALVQSSDKFEVIVEFVRYQGFPLNYCTSPFEHGHIAIHRAQTCQRGAGSNELRIARKIAIKNSLFSKVIIHTPPPLVLKEGKYKWDFGRVYSVSFDDRSVKSSRFDFVKIRNNSDEPWFGQVLLFVVRKKEKEEDNAESLVLVRNLQVSLELKLKDSK